MTTKLIQNLETAVQTNGAIEGAKLLVDSLREQERFSELFEALKMFHRMELGLAPVQIGLDSNEDDSLLEASIQDQLDRRLIDSCKEVGGALLERGQLQEGWMYMRAVGDRKYAAKALEGVEPTQENLDALLGLLVHEGIDVKRGTELSLSMRGTCNTITMMDSVVSMRGRKDQQAAVGVLVEHVHDELLTNLRSDLIRREGWDANHPDSKEMSIEKLLSSRPSLLKDGSYHLDTTHLASTVRYARILDDRRLLELALDLAHYGRLLHAQYQYASDEPFSDLYPMSLAFFRALLGQHVDAALKLFLQKGESLDPHEHGTVAIEIYADLLTRIGRPEEAMVFLIKRMPRGMRPFGIAPSLIELAEASGNYELMLRHASERMDDIGYAAALFQRFCSKK